MKKLLIFFLFTFLKICFIYSQSIPTNGLVAWYPFNSNANDQSGNNLNGVVNGATLTTDRFGNVNSAYDFNGISDFIEIANNSLLNFDVNNDFTISLWVLADVQINNGFTGDIFAKWEDNPGNTNEGYPYTMRITKNAPQGIIQMMRFDRTCGNFPLFLSNFSVIDGDWHNLIYVKDGSDLIMYIDGAETNRRIDNTVCTTINSSPLFIGKRGGTLNPAHYKGKIDDISIYNRTLTNCEIHELLDIDLSTDLIANYPFDGSALDVSGNGNHGSVNGATLTSDRYGNPNSAYSFDGINDYIDLNNDFDFLNRTINIWFKLEASSSGTPKVIYDSDHPTLNFGETKMRIVFSGDEELRMSISNSSTLSQQIINLNQWYMASIVTNGTDVNYYIDGQLIGSLPFVLAPGDPIGHPTVPLGASRIFDRYFEGKIDDIRIYERALSDCEIKELYEPSFYTPKDTNIFICLFDTIILNSNLNNCIWYANGNPPVSSQSFLAIANSPNQIILSEGLNTCGCTQTDTFRIQLKPGPTYNLQNSYTLCPGIYDTLPFNLNSNGSVLWTDTSLFVDPNTINPIIKPILNDSTFDKTITAFANITNQNNGCSIIDSIDIIIPHKPTSQITNDSVIVCHDEIGNYSWQSLQSSLINQMGYVFYGDTLFFPPGNVQSLGGLIGQNFDTVPRIDYFKVLFEDINGCHFVDSTYILTHARFFAEAGVDTFLCSNEELLIGETADSGYLYNWSSAIHLSDSMFSNPLFKFNNTTSSNSILNYFLFKTDTITNCIEQDSIKIEVNKKLIIDAGSDTLVCSQERISLGENQQIGLTYNWTGSDSLSSTLISNPIFKYLNPDTSIASFIIVSTATETTSSCDVSDTILIKVKPQIYLDAGQDIQICGSDSIAVGKKNDSRYSYSWFPKQGVADTLMDSTSYSLNNFTDTIHTQKYFLKANYDGCTESDSLIATVFPKAIDQLSGPRIVCPGVDTADYYSNKSFPDYTYNWFVDGGSIGNNYNDSITVSWDSTNFNAYVGFYPNNIYGCVGDTFIWNVRINPLLIPEIDIDTLRICQRDKDEVLYKIKYPISNSAYTWFVNNGQITSGQGTDEVEIDWDGVGIGKIWVNEENITNLDSCFGTSDTILVEIVEDPVLDSISGPLDLCDFGDSIWYSTNSSLIGTFFWTYDSISQIISGQGSDSVLISSNFDGDFTITSYILSNQGCVSDTLSQTVNVRYLQKPEIEIDTLEFCYDDSLLIDLRIKQTFQNSNYQWSTSAGQLIGQGTDKIELLVSQSDTIRIVVNELNSVSIDTCFTHSDTLEFIVHPYPISSQISGTFDFCDTQDSIYYIINGDQNSNFYWSTGGLSQILGTSSNDSLLINFTGDGDVHIEVYEENIYGCFGDTIRETINIRYLQKPQILADTNTICFWDSVDFSFRISDVYDSSEYQWSINSGQIISGQGESELQIRVFQPDTLFIYVSELNNAVEDTCYGKSDTLAIYFYPRPERNLSILGEDSICFNSDCEIYTYDALDNSQLQWNTSAGVCNTLFSDTLEMGFGSVGTYNLNVVETTEFGCIGDTVYQNIEIFPIPETEIVFNDSIICPSDQNAREYAVKGFDFSEYNWFINGGNIESGIGKDKILVNWNETQDLSLSVLEITFAECTGDTVSFPLYEDNTQTAIQALGYREDFKSFALDVNSEIWNELQADELLLLESNDGTDFSFLSLSPVDSIGENVFAFDSSIGLQSKFYQIAIVNACNDTVYSNIHNNMILNGSAVEASNQFSLEWNDYEAWMGEVNYDVYEYLKDTSKYLETTNSGFLTFQNPQLSFEHCYFILGRNNENNTLISRSNLVCFEFKRNLELPNVVTANGDGYNDKFYIKNLELYPNHKLQIFNRSGISVFKTETYKNDWPPDDLSPGVYFFDLSIDDNEETQFSGYLHLMR